MNEGKSLPRISKKKKKLVRLPEVYTVDRIIQQRHTSQEQEGHEALKRLPEKQLFAHNQFQGWKTTQDVHCYFL